MTQTRLVILLAALVWLVTPAAAFAQFETANRAFHNATGFQLDGRHRDVACESCHLNNVYKGTPTKCVDCHWVRRQDAKHRLQLGMQCEQCHRTTAWSAVRWDHAAMTGMPLGGAHRTLSCESCHQSGTFAAAQATCVTCHQKDFQAARTPNHLAAGFPTQCETCHRVNAATWQDADFNHNAAFPLIGVHGQLACASCHKNNVFKGTPRDCVGCHRQQFDRTTMPNHAAAGFPTTCENCHRATDAAWSGSSAGFNHGAIFPLVGRHAQQTCAACHVNNVFKGTARECVGCHRPQYERTTSPNHAAAGFPTTCEGCHRATDASWAGNGFNHAAVFPLVGVHAQQTCATCHVNNVFRGTARDCVGCHRPLYDRTTSPNHAAAGFSTACDSCHRATDTSWRGITFNHASVFPLVGRHAQLTCATCHVNNVYRGTARDCVGCHRPLYDRTTSPNHAAAGFPTTCDSCHRATDSTWTQGTFSHRFPITSGPHRVTCSTCHTSSSYQVFTCLVCHEHSKAVMDDKHRGRTGYLYDSLACYSCHPNGRH